MAPSDARGQVFPEDRQLFAVRGADMRGEIVLRALCTAVRRKQKEVG